MAVVSCIWEKIESVGDIPCARFGHAVQLLGEIAYLFGGSRTQQSGQLVEYFNDLYKISVVSGNLLWEYVHAEGTKPSPRDSHAVCCTNGHLYLFGGKNQLVSNRCFPEAYQLHIGDRTWTEITSAGPAPIAVGFTVGVVGRRVFAFGGICNGTATNDLHMFNLDTSEWIPVKCSGTPPSPRCDHGCEVVNDVMYVFGGAGAEDQCFNDLHCLDIESLSWSKCSIEGIPPTARAGHVLTAHRDKDIYVFGGYNNTADNDSAKTDLYKLSLGKKKWKRPITAGRQPPTSELHGHCAFILHSSMYVLGGIGPSGEIGMDSVYVLRFINPSVRKPVLQHMLNDLCKEKNSLSCWLPVMKPNVSYEVKFHRDEAEKRIDKFVASGMAHNLPLNKQLMDQSGDDEVDSVEVQKSLFCAARAELAFARHAFETDRADLVRLLERERTEVDNMVRRHRQQNEGWWKARIQETEMEREKLRKAWNQVDVERANLAQERSSLDQKAKQVAQLLRQVSDV